MTHLPTAPTVIARLCEDAVRIRKEAVAADGRSGMQFVLLGQLSGVRLALSRLHDWEDSGPQGPAAELILQWWKANLPDDWANGTAYANLLHFELNELLTNSPKYRTVVQLANTMSTATSTAYRAFSFPEQSSWETLSAYVKALDGELPRFERLWRMAQLQRFR